MVGDKVFVNSAVFAGYRDDSVSGGGDVRHQPGTGIRTLTHTLHLALEAGNDINHITAVT